MSSYSKSDTDIIIKNMDELIEKAEKNKSEFVDPVISEIKKLDKLILKFVKDNKRKIYGGYSQNEVIKAKNKKDAFYHENTIADIDMYSYDPIVDMMKLSNLMLENKFTEIHASEAAHNETYAIFVNFRKAIDISYVNKFVYDSIPTIIIDGIQYVHPHFSIIDQYKMVSDPYFSNFRWGKAINRIYVLEKNYPFPKPKTRTKELDFIITENNGTNSGNKISHGKCPDNIVKIKKDTSKLIFKFLENLETCVVFGECLYNVYADESGYDKLKNPFIRIISSNYYVDCAEIVDILLKNNIEKLSIIEFYPLWNLIGYTTYFTYDKYPIFSVSSFGGVCISSTISNKIQYASYDRNFLLIQSLKFHNKMNRQQKLVDYFESMTADIINMKEIFLKKKNKTILDDTIFQKFITKCIGKITDPMTENIIRRSKKYMMGKLVKFNYRPEVDGVKEARSAFRFANTSGNAIIENIKNMKIAPFVYNKLPLLQKELEKNNKSSDIPKTFGLVSEKLKSKCVEYE